MDDKKTSEEAARQGKKGTPVLMILIIGLVLCIALFIGFGSSGWFDSTSDLSNSENAPEVSQPADSGGTDGGSVVTPSEPETPSAPQ